MADKIDHLTIDSNNYDITLPVDDVNAMFYTTSSATANAFIVTIPGVDVLVDGMIINVKFHAATAEGATLNVNNLGAKAIYYRTSTAVTTHIVANNYVTLVYDATNDHWVMQYAYDNTGTNTIGYQLRTNSTVWANKTGYTMNRRTLLFEVDGGLSGAATSIATGTTKTTVNFKYIPGGVIKYYSTSGAIANDANFGATGLWDQYAIDLRYTFNTGSTLVSNGPVYMRCVINTDGTLTPDYTGSPKHPIAQVLPTTDDGKAYVYLGKAYSTSSIELYEHHPIYIFKNGKICLYTGVQSDWSASSGPTQILNKPTLGTSAAKDFTTSVTSGSGDLVTSGAVYTSLDSKSNATNIENGSGTNAIQEKMANATVNFTGRNANAESLDSSLSTTINTGASASQSIALNKDTMALGTASFANGNKSIAKGEESHAEGYCSVTLGDGSHAEGATTVAFGTQSHSEGNNTQAIGDDSHAEGHGTIAGSYTSGTKTGEASHAEGVGNKIGSYTADSSQGANQSSGGGGGGDDPSPDPGTFVAGSGSHAEGYNNLVTGAGSHVEGLRNYVSGNYSHAEGVNNTNSGPYSFVAGYNNINNGEVSFVAGRWNNNQGNNSFVIGNYNKNTSSLIPRFIAGQYNSDIYNALFEIGNGTADNARSNAMTVYNDGHVEIGAMGDTTFSVAIKGYVDTKVSTKSNATNMLNGTGIGSLKQIDTTCSGAHSFSSGYSTTASGNYSHTEGAITVASGDYSHAEGANTIASGTASHASGLNTNAKLEAQTVVGKFNKDATNSLFIVGNGTADSVEGRSNAFEVYQDGHAEVGLIGSTNKSVVTKEYVDSKPNLIETTYSNLKSLRDNSQLIPGRFYRITDYTCTTTTTNTSSAGHVFDIIVRADSTNKLNENASAILHSGDTYFANNKLESWKLWYSLDNNTNRFAWADSTNGKGVIYRMIDEFNNDIPYDFKNILFTKSGKYTNAYTFSYTQSSTINDASILGLSKICYDNLIKEYIYSNKQQLNFNVFYSTINLFTCYSNIFGNNCQNNTLGNSCYHNVFGNNCQNNTLGNTCADNTFGNSCQYNTFGNNCEHNTFGNSCEHNTFGNASSSMDYYQYNILDNGCILLYLIGNGTASSSNYVQNIHIHLGVTGTKSDRKTITVDRNLAYETDVYASGSTEMFV